VEGHPVISSDVLASYAADAALEVPGVQGVVESPMHRHRGVRILDEGGEVTVEVHLALAWGARAPEVGAAVQERVARYLARMADVTPTAVEVVVEEVGAPPA
jgi:uncharacterized alkaline shock family protein YloU